jgi:hypothetical protein
VDHVLSKVERKSCNAIVEGHRKPNQNIKTGVKEYRDNLLKKCNML